MCGLVAAGLALTAATTAMNMAASARQAQAQQQQLNDQARITDRQARDAIERGRDVENVQERQASQLLGSQRAAAAATGTEVNSGSALDIQLDTVAQSERDQYQTRKDAETEALNLRTQASMNRQQADSINPGARATSSFIGGASQFADRWYRFRETGGTPTPTGNANFVGGT